jgi:hypothetical protein
MTDLTKYSLALLLSAQAFLVAYLAQPLTDGIGDCSDGSHTASFRSLALCMCWFLRDEQPPNRGLAAPEEFAEVLATVEMRFVRGSYDTKFRPLRAGDQRLRVVFDAPRGEQQLTTTIRTLEPLDAVWGRAGSPATGVRSLAGASSSHKPTRLR